MFRKKKKLEYPVPFGLITFTAEALDEGVKDDQNKVILVYEHDRFNKVKERKVRLSDSAVLVLEKKGIPIFDKTLAEIRFSVYSRVNPGEAVFTSK